jgi:hypothetical protein
MRANIFIFDFRRNSHSGDRVMAKRSVEQVGTIVLPGGNGELFHWSFIRVAQIH